MEKEKVIAEINLKAIQAEGEQVQHDIMFSGPCLEIGGLLFASLLKASRVDAPLRDCIYAACGALVEIIDEEDEQKEKK